MTDVGTEQQVSVAPGAKLGLTPTSWTADGTLELGEWLDCGRRFGVLGRGVAWWIGDWLRYGNARYGERYTRAARVTGYDTQSLMNMAYVASRFETDRRKDKLSWSHHAAVAPLDEADQDRWLELAVRERLSVRSLRAELKAARRGMSAATTPSSSGIRADHATASTRRDSRIVCPRCSHVIDDKPASESPPP